jgi:hypothetical protein
VLKIKEKKREKREREEKKEIAKERKMMVNAIFGIQLTETTKEGEKG